jgi:hypothetical protein
MPLPARSLVVALGKHLFQPFHDSRKLQALLRLDIEPQPIIGDTQSAKLEHKPFFRFPEDLSKQGQSLMMTE